MKSSDKDSSGFKWKVSDILGFEVFDSGGKSVGFLTEVSSTGSNDIWTVKSDNREILIPALKSIVSKVDTEDGKIFVELPEGYTEIYGTETEPVETKTAESVKVPKYVVYED